MINPELLRINLVDGPLFSKKCSKAGIIADNIWALPICFFKNKLIKPEMLLINFNKKGRANDQMYGLFT